VPQLRIDVGGIVRQVDSDCAGGGELAHGGSNLLGGKAAILKEAGLLCTLRPVGRALTELPRTDLYCQGLPINLCGAQASFNGFGRNTPLPQLRPDSIRPLPTLRVLADETVHEAVIGNESLGGEACQDCIDRGGVETASLQLSPQIAARKLPAGQQAQGS